MVELRHVKKINRNIKLDLIFAYSYLIFNLRLISQILIKFHFNKIENDRNLRKRFLVDMFPCV